MKKVKGFSLIECIVALAILGIASLVMAEIYGNISRINRLNHNDNTSLAYQMKYVEESENAQAIEIKYVESSDKANHKVNSGSTQLVTITKQKSDGTVDPTNIYHYGCNTYVLYSRDYNDKNSTDTAYKGDTEDNYSLRYKYILGKAPTT